MQACARRHYREGMDSLISLQYPNGRIHEGTLPTTTALEPGDQFDLYGRSWNAIRLAKPGRGNQDEPRMLCTWAREKT